MTYEELLISLVAENNNFMVLTAENRAAIRNLPQQLPNNFIDTGITEQTMIGVAAGLALRGRKPIAHALATFLTMRAFEFIRTDVGIAHLSVKLVGAVPGFLSEANGPTHQALEDISLMRSIPGMKIFCPADDDDMLKGLPTVFKSDAPYYIRYNNLKPLIEHSVFEEGSAEQFDEGKDAAIITYGMLFNQCYPALKILKQKGINARLINLRTLNPLDEKRILNGVKECEYIFTIEDHFLTGGIYSMISELLVRERLTANIYPSALNQKWFKPALLKDVLEHEGFTTEKIAERIIEIMRRN